MTINYTFKISSVNCLVYVDENDNRYNNLITKIIIFIKE